MELNRLLRLAEILYESKDIANLNLVCACFGSHIRKLSHFIPDKNTKGPEFWKKNLDYDAEEDSPYFGSVQEFLEKYPGGIGDWLVSRKGKK
jgi:hypothetical protein